MAFSHPVDPVTVHGDSVLLHGPGGLFVQAKVIPSQDGLLAFLTPERSLFPDTEYTVIVNGVATANSEVLQYEAFNFRTRVLDPEQRPGREDASTGDTGVAEGQTAATAPGLAAASTPQQLQAAALAADDDEVFLPTAENHGGRWRTSRPLPRDIAKRLHELLGPKGHSLTSMPSRSAGSEVYNGLPLEHFSQERG